MNENLTDTDKVNEKAERQTDWNEGIRQVLFYRKAFSIKKGFKGKKSDLLMYKNIVLFEKYRYKKNPRSVDHSGDSE